jgi:hypothetical protein
MNVKQLVQFSWATLGVAVGILLVAPAEAGVIAHWSFDTPTITTGANGILTAADDTGVHNATTQYGGTGGAGGPQIDSVPGQFGQAASFTNANANGAAQTNFAWMGFPQITEIAGAAAGDFSVAAWVNVADQASWDDNPILIDWGTAPAGTHRFTYWFQLDNVDSNAGLRPRAQIRNTNSPPDPNPPGNIDIIATTLSAGQAGTGGGPTNFDDGAWHHLAWTWAKSTGAMSFYTDGVLRHTQTSTQPLAMRDLLVSDSLVGALGAKRDNNRYYRGIMDEVWVFNDLLNADSIQSLYRNNMIPEPACGVLTALGMLVCGAFARRRT